MRILKLLLLALFVVVGGAFVFTSANQSLSGERVPPVIQCDTELLEVSVSDEEAAILSGVTASDKQDGDITAKIQIQGISKLITNDTAKVSYVVFDSDGNVASCTRQIRYTDYQKPHFSLLKPLIYQENEDIQLLDRLTATDAVDGDITEQIRVSSLAGTYDAEVSTVAVQVTNSLGDTARLNLPVVKYSGAVVRPEIKLTQYLVYLETGDSFVANGYLASVTTPAGAGNRSDVQIVGSVDTQTPGTYYVYYRYPYSMTSAVTVLTVVVE